MTNQELQTLKNKFDIIGNDPALNRALEIAVAVAPTDIAVLVTGESGVGKENIPRIIHQNSARRRGKYFAVNCGAIPEGTIDSELFGHEKGSFTGASEMRKGYFEEADKVLMTDVRVVAATNVDLLHAVSKGKFRADLYYRLNSIVISMPALRERPGDINLLFRKFASDFSVKYGMAKVSLTEDASIMLRKYRWPGNIRQLKNVAEAVSAMEAGKLGGHEDKCVVDMATLAGYIPREEPNLLPATVQVQEKFEASEKEAIIRTLLQLKQDVDYLKEVVANGGFARNGAPAIAAPERGNDNVAAQFDDDPEDQDFVQDLNEQISIKEANMELIEKVLRKHDGNRKAAAAELGISERTLYRKIKK